MFILYSHIANIVIIYVINYSTRSMSSSLVKILSISVAGIYVILVGLSIKPIRSVKTHTVQIYVEITTYKYCFGRFGDNKILFNILLIFSNHIHFVFINIFVILAGN